MERLARRMRREVLEVQGLLSRWTFTTFTQQERDTLLERAAKLLGRLDDLSDQVLLAGLLGGTGVGKSTLMNALAGAEISSTSHRRPHTREVLLYRHEDAALPPDLERASVKPREFVHDAHPVRQMILCDLPDFDSLVGEHRQRVVGFLEHLDVLVWVTTPEKYADRQFYTFLGEVPKARLNFYFVLNKMDLLFRGGDLEPGYRQLSRLTVSFRDYLLRSELTDPLVYPVSAREALDGSETSPWNQFSAFRQEIFRQRDAKEVMSIKSANLDRQVRDLLSRLEQEVVQLDALREALGGFARRFEEERDAWRDAGGRIVEAWSDTHLGKSMLVRLDDPSALVGPGYGIARIVAEWKAWKGARGDGKEGEEETSFPPPPERLRAQMERVQDLLLHRTLLASLPEAVRSRLRDAIQVDRTWDEFVQAWTDRGEGCLAARRPPVRLFFRAGQYLAYSTLFVLLLLALSGEEAVRSMWAQPGWASLSRLGIDFVQRLFSATGLAALLSYALIHVLLGVRYYRRHRARLRHRAARLVVSLQRSLSDVWGEALERVRRSLEECQKDLDEQRALFDRLSREDGSPDPGG